MVSFAWRELLWVVVLRCLSGVVMMMVGQGKEEHCSLFGCIRLLLLLLLWLLLLSVAASESNYRMNWPCC